MPTRKIFDEPHVAVIEQTSARALAAPALRIFVAALALRWAYALVMYALLGDDGLKGGDSVSFAAQAQQFADAIRGGLVHGSHWLGEASYIAMPLYQWFTAVSFLLFGGHGAIGNVLLQGVLDSGTCVFVYKIARSLDERLGLPSAIAAILNPTQIVLSGLIYTDTSFTFFVALAFCAAVRLSKNPIWTKWSSARFRPRRRNAHPRFDRALAFLRDRPLARFFDLAKQAASAICRFDGGHGDSLPQPGCYRDT